MCSKLPRSKNCCIKLDNLNDLCTDEDDNISNEDGGGRLRRGQLNELNEEMDKCSSKTFTIKKVHFGEYEIRTRYFSPYPTQFQNKDKILICKYCLTYRYSRERSFERHMDQCEYEHPPGLEIYRKDHQSTNISVWELNPSQDNIILYCRYLCLLARFFLGDKQISYDVEPFLFYVLCKSDEKNLDHMIGFFSKEKDPIHCNNVACIMLLPQFRGTGYGHFLIDLSYMLSKAEGRIAGPEAPLSEDGKRAYMSYWFKVLANILITIIAENSKEHITIESLSKLTSIRDSDILSALEFMNCRKRGEPPTHLQITQKLLGELSRTRLDEPRILLDPGVLNWTPTEHYPPTRLMRLYQRAKLQGTNDTTQQLDESHIAEVCRKDEDNLNPSISIKLSVNIQSL